MKYRVNLFALLAAFLTVNLAGCATADRIRYVHEPTDYFFHGQDHDIDDVSLRLYFLGGVLVAPYLGFWDYEDTSVSLGLFSKSKGAEIWVENVVLIGNSKPDGPIMEVQVGKVFPMTTYFEPYGLFTIDESLFLVETAELESLSQGESVYLILFIKPDGDSDEIVEFEYEFKREVETYVVSPTWQGREDQQ